MHTRHYDQPTTYTFSLYLFSSSFLIPPPTRYHIFSVFSSCSIHHPRPLMIIIIMHCMHNVHTLHYCVGFFRWHRTFGCWWIIFLYNVHQQCKSYITMLRRTKPAERRSAIIIVIIFIILVFYENSMYTSVLFACKTE